MDVLKTVPVKINDLGILKKFAFVVSQFESDIDIIKGRNTYDAKSIMAVLAIDTSNGAMVEILSDDEEEIKRFVEAMEEFK